MFYGWILLGALSFIYFLSIGSIFYGFSVVIPQIIENTGWTRAEVGAGFSVMTLTLGLSGPVVAVLLRRFGARGTMTLGGGVIAAGCALVYAGPSLLPFYLGLAVIGVGMAMQTVLPGTHLLAHWFERRRALAIGVFMASAGLGAFVAAPVFAAISESTGSWRIVMPIMAGSALLSSVLAFFVVRETPAAIGEIPDGRAAQAANTGGAHKPSRVHQTTEAWTLAEALRTRAFWLIVLGAALAVVGTTIVNSQSVLHMEDLGLSRVLAASALGITGLLSTLGRLFSGGMGDRVDPKFLLGCGLALELMSVVILQFAGTAVIAYTFAVLFGLGYGLASVASPALIANYFGSGSYAPLFATRGVLVTVLGAAGPILAGLAYDASGSYSLVFYAYAALSAVGVFLVLSIRPPVKAVSAAPST